MLSTVCEPPIKGFIETSFLDWKECLSSVIFLGGCNFRCPYCHNKELVINHEALEDIPMEYIIATLRKYQKWVDKVVITGGEPTVSASLLGLISQLKREKMLIKLDTNGSNPQILKSLVNERFVDYVAMDVKGPIDQYSMWTGVNVDAKRIQESIEFLLEDNIDYEFRMTVVPFLHREDDIYEVASFIKDAKKFFIQEFRPGCTLNPAYEHMDPFPQEKIEKIRTKVAEIMTKTDQTYGSSRQKPGLIKQNSSTNAQDILQ